MAKRANQSSFATSRARPRLPRDEQAEAQERRLAQRLQEVALQQLEWSHERTREAQEAGRREEADGYAMTALAWIEKLVN